MKQGNTFVLPLKLHLRCMYRKGFFPFIPSPNQCYRFSLYTGCASRVCESAFIRLTEHAAAWRACLLEQGLGDLLDGLSKQVLTIFFLLCWRDSALRLAGKQKERFAAASEGLTIEQYRAMHPTYREDKEDDNHD
ncbi:hypothetical protein JK323_09850 [Klebsiella michiganensis]|nr:hypothetical protein [Klebsiella michiganensis]